ncbi:hypothetical protein MCUN1_003131 [Malassezia cuniculi]|uniref:RRM domain-containing protein n=1 Tax=Malassezia cuniculi TaxID=948313 RepID=A0AAF0J7H2_9BASI|nr:hypothetical protein MCUN1_003131 [Malassezia cuniculi]
MTEVRRIHISGLGGKFSREELERRLSSYGEVLDFDGCEAHHVDGVGNPRTYAFATLKISPTQLSKCMNTLSGVIWKGTRLRVAEAKPQWNVRLEREREKQAEKNALEAERALERRKKWLRRRPWIAVEAHDMSPVTAERIENGEWGWHVTPAGHLVRPMQMRPSRPIPTPGESSRTTRPRSRACRVVIDPTRYTREHITGAILGDADGALQWEFHDGEWIAYEDGKQVAVEKLQLKERQVPQSVTWGDWKPNDEPESRTSGWADLPADGAGDDLWAGSSKHSRGAGLFDSDDDADPAEWDAVDADPAEWDTADAGDDMPSHVSSPQSAPDADNAPPIKLGRLALPDEESDFSDGYDELQATDTVSDERSRAHSFLTRLFGQDAFDTPAPPPVHVPVAEDEMDEESVAGSSEPEELGTSEQPEATPEATPEAADESAEAPEEENQATADAPSVHIERLKDMFQPSADTGAFSLFDDLELDLGEDPLEDAPAPEPQTTIPTVRSVSTTLPFLTQEPRLAAALRKNGWTPFWTTDDDAAIETRWTESRSALTQAYKRMHREALKKRRRRVVGSRASAAAGGSALRRDARSSK